MKRIALIVLVIMTGWLFPVYADDEVLQTGARELYTVLAIGDPILDEGDWLVEAASERSDRTQVTWSSSALGALAHFEYLHFEDGVTKQVMDTWFSADSFDVMFGGYESFEEADACRANGLRLYEFDAREDGFDYRIRLWGQPMTSTRLLHALLVFPADEMDALDDYAEQLFPELPSCEES